MNGLQGWVVRRLRQLHRSRLKLILMVTLITGLAVPMTFSAVTAAVTNTETTNTNRPGNITGPAHRPPVPHQPIGWPTPIPGPIWTASGTCFAGPFGPTAYIFFYNSGADSIGWIHVERFQNDVFTGSEDIGTIRIGQHFLTGQEGSYGWTRVDISGGGGDPSSFEVYCAK